MSAKRRRCSGSRLAEELRQAWRRKQASVVFVGEDGVAREHAFAAGFDALYRPAASGPPPVLSLDCPEVNGFLARLEELRHDGELSREAEEAFIDDFRRTHVELGCRVCFPEHGTRR